MKSCLKSLIVPISKRDWIIAAVLAVILVVALVLTCTPKDKAQVAEVYVGGKLATTYDLSNDYNPVATFQGVLVRTTSNGIELVYRQQVTALDRKGTRVVYPTVGVEVRLK